ncbi:MAG TPA: hypothetical protein VGB30_02735 [bacterium]
MKPVRVILTIILIVIVLGTIVLGPGTSAYLKSRGSDITRMIGSRTDGNVIVNKIRGNFFSGFTLEKVVVYSDKSEEYLPLLSADTVKCRLTLMNILTWDFTPGEVQVDGFDSALHVGEDGKMVLPDWEVQTSQARTVRPFIAGYVLAGSGNKEINVFLKSGVLEVYKKFPGHPEPVDLVITQLQGDGIYYTEGGLQINSITGDYQSSPVTVQGYVATDESKENDVELDFGELNFSTIFRDIDPLFRNSQFLPTGNTSGSVHLAGGLKTPEVTGNLAFSDSTFANVSIESAETSFSYSAGVLDLSGIRADSYGGILTATGQLNLLSTVPRWELMGEFQNLDFAKYIDQIGYRHSYELNGLFSGEIIASGDFLHPENLDVGISLNSDSGTFLSPFSDGMMQGLAGAVLSDESRAASYVDYDQLEILARIDNRKINLERFHFLSYDLQVEATGQVGFDHSISASGGMSVPLDKARQHPQFGQYIRFLPDSVNRATLDFTLSGHLEDIKFNPKVSDNFLRGVLDDGDDLVSDRVDEIKGFDFDF